MFTASYYVCWGVGLEGSRRSHGSGTLAGGEPLERSVALNLMRELG